MACLSHACGRPNGLGFWGRGREASKAKPKQVRFAEKPNTNVDIPVRRSGRRLCLGGQEVIKPPGRDQAEKREENAKMSSLRGSSSEATNTNEEDIATGMMHSVSRQSSRFERAAGKKTLRS